MKVAKAIFDYEISGHGHNLHDKGDFATFVIHNERNLFDDARQAAKAKVLRKYENEGVKWDEITIYGLKVDVA